MTPEEIKEVLRLHKLWMNGDSEGRRADLHGTDLRKADLRKADLRKADLRKTDLRWTDLRWTDLRKADLRGASLYGADLYGTQGAIVSAGPAGSERRITYYLTEYDEVQCGCFCGTLAEFEARVETEHKEHPRWLAEYRAMIVYFKALRELE